MEALACRGGAQGPALVATITVDNTCTLVDAITSANGNTAAGGCIAGDDLYSGGDILTLPTGSTQTLTAADNSTYGPTGLPVIASEITIQGNGSTARLSVARMQEPLTFGSLRSTAAVISPWRRPRLRVEIRISAAASPSLRVS